MFDNFWSFLRTLWEYNIIIAGVLMSITIASIKSMKEKGVLDWLEALLCACLTLALSSALEYLKLPQQMAIFLGGLIGFKGSKWIDAFINRKMGE